MPEKSPEIPREEELSPKEEKPLELGGEESSTAEKIKALKKMKELVEGRGEKELPPERRLTEEEKRKIGKIIEKAEKNRENVGLWKIEEETTPFGEKIVEPFLNKLESLRDQDLREKDWQCYYLIRALEEVVKSRDAERLANLLLRDPIAYDPQRSNKINLLRMLGNVGDEKIIDKLTEYSQKVIKTPYPEDLTKPSSRSLKTFDQENIKEALVNISERKSKEETDREKIKEIKTKTERALDTIKENIESLGE